MNKTKKIVAIAVSAVMAGTMAATLFAACTPGAKKTDGLKPKVDADGKLTYSDNITLNTAIGYSGGDTGIKYSSDTLNLDSKGTGMYKYLGLTGASSFSLFGKTYSQNDLKPAWQALSDQLKIKINDTWTGKSSDSQMSEINSSELKISGYNIFTASAADISDEGTKGNLLNISDYLDYMPNYKAFLKEYPNARLSLTADSKGSMYMLPYFDGNDDIEKYVLLRKDVVGTLLDDETADLTKGVTFKAQGEAKNNADNTKVFNVTTTSASVESFMGKTAADNYTVKVTNPEKLVTGSEYKGYKTQIEKAYADGTKSGALVDVTVNYGAALTAAKDPSAGLGAAINAAAGKAYTGTSGNIIDLQNFVINEKAGEVKGGELLKILREYIKVAYQNASGAQFYTKLSDVFNSAYAAWDVDLYVALGRCYVTCGEILNAVEEGTAKSVEKLYLLSGRRNTTQRINDVISFAGELYGVRGLESRYMYSYVKEDGNLTDARNKAVTYEAVGKLNKLLKEGLLVGGSDTDALGTADKSLSSASPNLQVLSLHDYVQTQTAFNIGANASDPNSAGPVLTPVSRWDTDGDGTYDKTMRFTESWRGVKNTGWCISKKAVENDPEKLSACLAFVDYFFSNDGQILMTYGPQSAKGDTAKTETNATDGGFWYGTPVTEITWEKAVSDGIVKTNDGTQYFVDPDKKDADDVYYKSKYFAYGNKLYTGTLYVDKQVPTMTSLSLDMFKAGNLGKKSFTNYARYYVGTALNIGNKDQGFEFQCTAESGVKGANIVNIAIVNGTIEHVAQSLPTIGGSLTAAQKYDNWKCMTASVLPYSKTYSTALNSAPYNKITGFNLGATGKSVFVSANGETFNLMVDIMTTGLGNGTIHQMTPAPNMPATAQGVVDYVNSLGEADNIPNLMDKIESYMHTAWLTAVNANK